MKNKVLKGDCLELMKEIPDKSIDMILCDLPYGTTACKWDVIISFEPLWEQYKRVIKDNGAIVLTSKGIFTAKLILSNECIFKYSIIWQKNRPTAPSLANKRPLCYHEDICVFYKKQPIYNPQMTKGLPNHNFKEYRRISETQGNISFKPPNLDGLKFPKSILKFNREHLNILHPTQKPVTLFEYLIKTYTNEGDLVLDNCAGSGTTAIACINTNRNYILMEKEQEYFDIINKRIEKHINEK